MEWFFKALPSKHLLLLLLLLLPMFLLSHLMLGFSSANSSKCLKGISPRLTVSFHFYVSCHLLRHWYLQNFCCDLFTFAGRTHNETSRQRGEPQKEALLDDSVFSSAQLTLVVAAVLLLLLLLPLQRDNYTNHQ